VVLTALTRQADFVTHPALTFNGSTVISTAPGDIHYFGNSQGGIMGTLFLSVSPHIARGVLGVGGGPYALLLARSTDFGSLFDVIKLRYPRPQDRISVLTIIQALWDRADPAGYMPLLTDGGPSGLPHRALWQYGLGDAQVTWLGAHLLAHSVGAVMFASQLPEGNESLAYFPAVPDATVLTDGHAIQGYSFDLPQVPFVNVPPSDGFDAHECPRRTPAAQAQMARFFYTGEIANACGGPCVTTPPPDNCAGG
jgi:pimeloyl-ACP methyl ester carboxylesterase